MANVSPATSQKSNVSLRDQREWNFLYEDRAATCLRSQPHGMWHVIPQRNIHWACFQHWQPLHVKMSLPGKYLGEIVEIVQQNEPAHDGFNTDEFELREAQHVRVMENRRACGGNCCEEKRDVSGFVKIVRGWIRTLVSGFGFDEQFCYLILLILPVWIRVSGR